MTCYPILGILTSIFLYYYMKKIYNKVVVIDVNEIPSLNDVEYYSQNIMDDRLLQYPIYISDIDKKPLDANVSKVNLHKYNYINKPFSFTNSIFI